MRKMILFLFLILTNSDLFSQNFTIDELILLFRNSSKYFTDYCMNKGCTFYPPESSSSKLAFIVNRNKSNYMKGVIIYKFDHAGQTVVSYIIDDKKEIKKLREYCENNFIKRKITEGNTGIFYRDQEFKINFLYWDNVCNINLTVFSNLDRYDWIDDLGD